ncbi:MAG: Gfo/Idh/MocA family protein, partial [Verrucomicrobiales bacterium]
MPTKVGIIGAGGMVRYHIAGFKAGGAEIVAIADLAVEAAQKVADENGIDHVYGDIAKMLEEADIDAVSIIVPNKFHAPLALQALKAGKHVFCEKPPALNAAEVTELIAAADESGKTLMFNFNNRA